MALPSRSPQGVAAMRATMSLGPPGAEATIRRIGRLGYCGSAAGTVGAEPSPAAKAQAIQKPGYRTDFIPGLSQPGRYLSSSNSRWLWPVGKPLSWGLLGIHLRNVVRSRQLRF